MTFSKTKRPLNAGDLVEIDDTKGLRPTLLTYMKSSYGIGVVIKTYQSYYWVESLGKSANVEYAEVYFFAVGKKVVMEVDNLRKY